MSIKIAENIQALRKKKHLTQEELAEVFGVTSQSISKWELGLSCPDISVLPILANMFDVTVDYLLDVDIEKKQLPFPIHPNDLLATSGLLLFRRNQHR